MFTKNNFLILKTAVVIFFMAVFSSAVYFYSIGAFYSAPFERLLPTEVSLVFSIQPTDENERGRFNKMLNIVMQDKANALLPLAINEIFKKSEVVLTMEESALLSSQNTDFEIAYATPNLYLLFSSKNPLQAREILKKHAKKLLIDKEKYFLAEFGESEKFFAGIAGDIVFMTDAEQKKVEKIIARSQSPFRIFYKSFASTDLFQRGLKDIKKPLSGYAAISSELMKGYVVSIHAEEDGLSFRSTTIGSEVEGDFKPLLEPFSAYLYKKLPAEKLLIFSESHHVGAAILAQLNTIESSAKTAGFKKEDFFTGLKNYTGFDFEKDLMPFLDREFAFTAHDTGLIIPALSFFIDAESAPDKAKNVVTMFDDVVPRLAAAANAAVQDSNGKPVVEMGKFKWGAQGGILKVDLRRVPQDKFNIPVLKYFNQPIEISYGIAADNLFFISLLPDFEKTFASADKIESTELFESSDRLGILPTGNITLVDGTAILAFVERFFDVMQKENKLSEKERSGFEIVKAYLKPLKSFVQISQGDSQNILGKAFLKIEK